MQRIAVWMMPFFLIYGVSQSFAESEPLLPKVDVEFIIAGLGHAESMLKSGTGDFKIYGGSYFSTGGKEVVVEKSGNKQIQASSVEELKFAFSGEYSFFKRYNGEVISDGKIQLIIAEPHRGISMYLEKVFPPEPLDPRDWGLWYKRQKLRDYLRQQKEVRLVGSDKVDNTPCYIIQMPDLRTQDAILKFWIAPERGFRLVQILYQTNTKKELTKIQWQDYQLQDEQVVWFPKYATFVSTPETGGEFRNEVEITNFQPNIDVSKFFDLQIQPETEVWPVGADEPLTFKEIGWKKLETRNKNKEKNQ